MGGGYYSFDVAQTTRVQSQPSFDYKGYKENKTTGKRGVHDLLNIQGKWRECMNNQAVVVAMDVTRSRGDDARIIYDKLPMLIGWLEMQGYLPDAAISLAAIGDANSDHAPLQVSQWEKDNRLDEALSKFWLEGGGGGTGEESYELAAYFYANYTRIKINEQGHKGYFFFIGDEGFYPTVEKQHVKQVLGQNIPADVPSDEVFRKLQEKFHVFFIYPQKSWQDRRADIDAEIAQRVKLAGGQYEDVDIRVSLLWNTRDDLDLHVIAPSGEEISYSHKQSRCGGTLDVDRNVRGEDPKPVENVRWMRGQAPSGRYQVIVQNFRFHEKKPAPIEFRVEIDVNGAISHYQGVISKNFETQSQSDYLVTSFDFSPQQTAVKYIYTQYDDTIIQKQWAGVLPSERILLLDDPASVIDVMVGAIGLTEGKINLDNYLRAMVSQDTKESSILGTRRQHVAHALGNLQSCLAPVARTLFDAPLPDDNAPKRTTRRW